MLKTSFLIGLGISVFLCCMELDLVSSQSAPSTFRYGQFLPTKNTASPTESQTRASGPIRDVIRRNSARFRKVLVRNANSEVEFTTDDARYMSSRAKSKLDVLASRVQSTWGNRYKVRVIKAWTDNVDMNNLLSLHYEGRAMEIQMNDRDTRKLGRLAGLALESGFDWVYYGNPNFVTISVIPDVCQTKLDLALVIDTSGSVTWQNFLKVRVFLKKVIDFFNIGRTETHVALISYSFGVTREFSLTRYFDKWNMKAAIERMKYEGGSTATGDALHVMRTWAFGSGNGVRTDKSIPKVGILLTDGKSNTGRNVYYAAREVSKAGISMFVVGVGSNLRIGEINAVATDPDNEHVFRLDTFHDLNGFVDQLSTVSCDEGAAVSQCDSAETNVEGGSFKYFKGEFESTTSRVTIEVQDKVGKNFLYISLKNKNPGPLDRSSIKSMGDRSPRAVTVDLRSSASKIVYISVQGQMDKNNFLLSIWDSLFPKDVYEVEILEEENAGLRVIRVISDQTGYTFKYSIAHGNDRNSFAIDSSTGQITTKRQFDREVQAFYSLVIVAEDIRLQCHKGRTQVDIKIKDKNDNSPKFTQNSYVINIREDTPVNQLIHTVSATDADEGSNAKIQYFIERGPSFGFFRINDRSGQIFLAQAVDYETTKVHRLTLRAVDGGNPARSATASLVVNIVDVNEPPAFTTECTKKGKGPCTASIEENKPAGTQILKLAATDPDQSQTCPLEYSIRSSDQYYFRIDKASGQITTSRPLDRELKEFYDLDVQVKDCGSLAVSTMVIVTATDLNDNSPVFTSKQYSASVAENRGSGTRVMQVKASDADAGNNARITYIIDSGNTDGAFSIGSTDGWIQTTKSLDREKVAKYSLVVKATDQGKPALSSTVPTEIVVIDQNDNSPVFEGTKSFSVKENVAKNTLVGKVTVKDKDIGLNGQVRCSIVGGNVGYAFRVDARSCNIYSSGSIDRETTSSYQLLLEATDLGTPSLSARQSYQIKVIDENDNAPIFAIATYHFSVKENAAANTQIGTVAATDRDEGINQEILYKIVAGDDKSPKFSIDPDKGILMLTGKLNFGTKNVYNLVVRSEDKGTPQMLGGTMVKVTVEDTNDFKPEFSKSKYEKSIPENHAVGTAVIQVSATDKDSGPSGKFLFSITSGNVGNTFVVNSVSGMIKTQKSLDYETVKSYTLSLMVKDLGNPSMSSTATVEIKITDVNDNSPTLTQKPTVFVVSEGANSGDKVGVIKATDKDSGVNQKLTFTSSTTSVPFKVARDGTITVNGKLDYETTKQYVIDIKVVDKGVPERKDTGQVIIKITDANDNKPVFGGFSCEIIENSKKGSHVCYVRATDADSGPNAVLTYSMKTNGPFVINKNTAAITTDGSLDRETTDEYNGTVTATDSGSPPLSQQVPIKIKVKDENDNAPIFDKKRYSFQVTEEQDKKVMVGTVKATDKDIGSNAELVYSIIGGNIRTSFSVNSKTGELTAERKLDRETTASYTLLIRVYDKGVPSLSAEVYVDVKVVDINDNDPLFSTAAYSSKIREDAATGSKIVQVSATDADAGKNGEVVYSIVDGKLKDNFVIDATTGVIRTKVALDYETVPNYELTVKAADKGTPSRSTTSKVVIAVTNVDDNAPEFGKVSEAKVSEGVNVGTAVVKFNAKDKDGGVLTYEITGGNTDNAFEVDSVNGELKVKKRLDRETTDSYTISVTVKDESGHSSTTNLPVKILDINDNNPIFTKTQYQGQIKENGAKAVLVTVSATDRDIGVNKEIEYVIDSGNKDDAFMLDKTTGELKTKRALDRETYASYSLKVKAIDKGSPRLSSVVPVDIKVLDENDNSPSFEKPFYNVNMAENGNSGTTVVITKANDPDAALNGQVTYSLVSENGGSVSTFTIDPSKGTVTTTKVLDREKTPFYTVVVKASDGGKPARSSTVVLNVTVLDENDNPPVIVSPDKIGPLKESTPVKEKVAEIKAKDDDVGTNGKFSFQITSGNVNNAFHLDPDSGILTVNSKLDRETRSVYKLRIQVKDKGSPSLQTYKDYIINITDVNDNCPQFNVQSFEEFVSEDVKENSPVMTIKAYDADIGANAKLSYSIKKSANSDDFKCDATTGQVTTAKLLDYEKIDQYNLECEVTDGQCKDDVPCIIYVRDVNDNFPIFANASYSVRVKEDVRVGTEVLTVKATDKDSFGQIVYEIVPKSKEFTIGSQSGKIETAAILDRETTDKYILVVKATDGGQPSKSTTVNVTIYVDDVNDNAPKFAKPSATVTVQENKKKGEPVYTLVATDADKGINQEIIYEIKKGPSSSSFVVDGKTGKVTTTGPFDRETKSSYTVSFVAKDKGNPQRTSEPFTLTVNVGDENDNKPIFKKSNNVSVSEGDAVGTNVQGILAEDKDIGMNAEVRYKITGGIKNGEFLVDNVTGVITVGKKLDRETVNKYTLVITGTDLGKPNRLSGTTKMLVTVTDINDNAPVFDPKTLIGAVRENKKKGSYVMKVVATDKDLGSNAEITYSLSSSDKFTIDSKTGVITTLQVLDREEKNSYSLKVTATDLGKPPLSTTDTLRIGVLDEDDNCPIFSPKFYNVTIQEKLKRGTVILKVTASDRDVGTNAALAYAVKEGDDRGAFTIDSKTGEVKVVGDVDREYSSVYHLRIRAGNPDCGIVDVNDTNVGEGGKKQQKNDSLADVYIHVTDINDNAPRFGSPSYTYYFKDSRVHRIMNITAVDKDTGKGGEVRFRLKDVRGFKSAGREGRHVIIEAFDLGTPSLAANTTVTIITELACGAMSFTMSDMGVLTVVTLCGFSVLPKPKSVLVGETLVLNCKADGNEGSEYHWLRDGSIVSSPEKTGVLTIQKAQQDSEGGYSCVAYNGAGTIQSQSVKVEVFEKPHVINEPEDISVSVGSDAVLRLKATGDPTPDYQWYRGGRPYYEGEGSKTDTLTLKRAIVQDEGEYYCMISNSVGQVKSRTLALKVFEKQSVVTLTLNVTKPDGKGDCNVFIREKFEKELGSILGKKVSVTEMSKSDICNVTACNPNPCQNKGKCELTSTGYHCVCDRAWTGSDCEKDLDECKSDPPICQYNGTCTNSEGSYKCQCPKGRTGRNCNLKADGCAANPCFSNQTCVLTDNNPPATRRCIPKGQEFEVVMEIGKDGKIDKYKLEEILNRMLKTMNQKKTARRRRDTTTKVDKSDFSACNVRIVEGEPEGTGKAKVRFVLVCPKNLQKQVAKNKEYFCNGILTSEAEAKSCGLKGEPPSTVAPKKKPPPSKVQVKVVVRDDKTGKALSAGETTDLLKEKDAKEKLAGSGVNLQGSEKTYEKEKEKKKSPMTAIIVGVCVAILVLIIAIVIAVIILRRKKDKQQSQAYMISGRAEDRRQSKEDLLRADMSLGNIDTPGMTNKGFSKDGQRDSCAPPQESFMFEMPEKVTSKNTKNEIESLAWYRGVFTEEEAQKYFDHCKSPGSYMLYKTGDGKIVLAVKAPDGGPPVRHIPITKSSSGEFVAKVGSMAPISGENMNTIVEHFRVTPMTFGDTTPDVVLTEPWQKTAL